MRTWLQSKAMAKSLRESLAAKNVALSHGECLDIVARQFGFGNWNILSAKIDIETREEEPARQPVNIFQLLPVLLVASRAAARDFYVDVLGFRFDWGDEDGGQAFYAQISRGELQMHVTTGNSGGRPLASQVYFRMTGIDAFCQEIGSRMGASQAPAIRDTNYDARELAIVDPFGNLLRFVENNPPGVSAGA